MTHSRTLTLFPFLKGDKEEGVKNLRNKFKGWDRKCYIKNIEGSFKKRDG